MQFILIMILNMNKVIQTKPVNAVSQSHVFVLDYVIPI